MNKLQVYDKTTGTWADMVGELVCHGRDENSESYYFTGKAVRPKTGMIERFAVSASAREVSRYIECHEITGDMYDEGVYIPYFIAAGVLREDGAGHDET